MFRESPSRQQRPAVPIPEADIERIIVQGDPKKLVEWAEKIGRAIVQQQVTTGQIRNVFGTARQIQLRWPNDPDGAYREAVLLRPKLAYFAKRAGRGMEDLRQVLVSALEFMGQAQQPEERKARFDRFMDFFEAIVAYHKAYGGKEGGIS